MRSEQSAKKSKKKAVHLLEEALSWSIMYNTSVCPARLYDTLFICHPISNQTKQLSTNTSPPWTLAISIETSGISMYPYATKVPALH